jgi:hypothetical protein
LYRACGAGWGGGERVRGYVDPGLEPAGWVAASRVYRGVDESRHDQLYGAGYWGAITAAKNSANHADALMVSSPSLEAAFVATGDSVEPLGRPIFYNDEVIVGPNGNVGAEDPAGSQLMRRMMRRRRNPARGPTD